MSDKVIKVGILYNMFDVTEREAAELTYRKGTMLKTYLSDLPTNCDWLIGLNGIPVTLESHGQTRLKHTDIISLVVVPHGHGVKGILRTVAQLAVAVGAAVVGGLIGGPMGAAAGAALALGGSLLLNALFPVKTAQAADTTQSYGYDGAKNTSKPGVALPVVYGTYRCAGNYVDLFTENVGNDQYLYGRTILSDGPIDGVSDALIEDQDISNYANVDWGYTTGLPNQPILPDFSKNVTQIAKSVKIVGYGDWVKHTTTNPVQQIEVNIEFTRGLIAIGDTGKKHNWHANFEVQYSETGQNNWRALGSSSMTKLVAPATTTPSTDKLAVTVKPTLSGDGFSIPYEYQIQYKLHSSSTWTTFKDVKQTSTNRAYTLNEGGTIDWSNLNAIQSVNYQQTLNEQSYEWVVPQGAYDIRITGQGTLVDYSYRVVSSGTSDTYTFTDQTTAVLRKTIRTGTLDLGTYDIRIRKTSSEGDNEYTIDETYLTDIGEVTLTGVHLNNVAYGWYAIKMTEQLSSIPSLTFQVRGVKIRQYDIHGNVTTIKWSNNPAWIVLDMLIGAERGSPGMYDIDFPAFVEWAEWCDTKLFYYNGVMDTTTTLWDACQDVLKIGHAGFTRVGTKMSVMVDKPAEPVMLFGPGNIFKDTFKIDYMAITDRANEFEVSYYDETDGNKQKTVRIVDPDADNRGDLPRAVSYSIVGITNFEQAVKEAWYQLYNNRYLRRTVTFDAPIESIGLNLGDVALIQHDMMNWGTSGRIGAGSTASTVILDKTVDMQAGNDYSLLVIHNAIALGTGKITAISGGLVTVANATNTSITESDVERLVSGNNDVQIIDITYSGSTAYVACVTTTGLAVGQTVQFVATDFVEERDITFFDAATQTVHVATTAFSAAPARFSNYMFGIKTIVKKPYRLRSISGTGFDQRTLVFIEYNEAIYADPENLPPFPPTSGPTTTPQVTNLALSYDSRAASVSTKIPGIVTWQPGDVSTYGGADIFISLNGNNYTLLKTILNVTSAQVDLEIGDDVTIKVVAFSTTYVRAPIGSAPYISMSIQSGGPYIAPPQNVTVNTISFLASGLVNVSWGEADTLGLPYQYRVQVRADGTSAWDEYGTTTELSLNVGDLDATLYYVRVRTEYGVSLSTWATANFTVNTIPGQTIEPGATVGAPSGTLIGGKTVDEVLNEVFDVTPPGVPQNVQINNYLVNGKPVTTVSWGHVTDADLSFYAIQLNTNGLASGNYVNIGTAITESYELHGLTANIPIAVRVAAVDSHGNQSQYSQPAVGTTAKDTTPPQPVSGLKCTPSFRAVTVNWTNPSDSDVAGALVYFNTSSSFTNAGLAGTVNALPGATGGFTQAGLSTGVTYYYWAVAFDTSGNQSAPFGPVSVTTASISSADVTGGLGGIQNVDSLPANASNGTYVYLRSDGQLYIWKNGGWQRAIAAIDLDGKITGQQIVAGTIQAANIATDAITARTMGILGLSLFPDGQVQDASWWSMAGPIPSQPGGQNPPNSWYIDTNASPAVVNAKGSLNAWVTNNGVIGPSTQTNIQLFAPAVGGVIPGEYYEFKATLYNSSTRPNLSMVVQWFDASGNFILAALMAQCPNDTISRQMSGQGQAPTGAAYYRLYWDANGSATGFSGQCYVGGITVRQAAGGTLIVDGSITASKITADKLNADDILVTGSLSADKINSNSSLPASLTIGNTGFSLSSVASSASKGSVGYNAAQYTKFEAGTVGYGLGYNPGGFPVNNVLTSYFGTKPYITFGFNSTNTYPADGNQQVSLVAGHPGYGYQTSYWSVNPATRVWVGANAQVTGSAEMLMQVRFIDINGNVVIDAGAAYWTIGTGWDGNNWNATKKGTFFDLPANIYGCFVEFYLYSKSTSSECRTWIAEPQVTTCNPGQTVAPDFTSGDAPDAASIINANQTKINPGSVLISGANNTTLASWISGGDTTKIDGGHISTNSISANQLTIGNRNVQVLQTVFNNDGINTITWTPGYVEWYDEYYNRQVTYIQGGSGSRVSQGGGVTGVCYVWFDRANSPNIQNFYAGEQSAAVIMSNPNNVIIASYLGGSSMNSNYGQTVINGANISTGTITANQIGVNAIYGRHIVGNEITADKMNVTALSAISANIGSLVSYNGAGGRVERDGNGTRVYDNNGVLRVRMGFW